MTVQRGTITAHGKTWPTYERQAYIIDIAGSVHASSAEDAEERRAELEAVLGQYGIEVKVKPLTIVEMSPEDQAEKNVLDGQVIDDYYHPEKYLS